MTLLSRKTGTWVLIALTAVMAVADLLLPRIPQPAWYHAFADQRTLWGVPNFGNVISNVPFAVVGMWGLVFLLRLRREEMQRHFVDARERYPYYIVFAGLVLTAWGSAYYHLHPDNARLVWDRIPMTIVFMPLVAALTAERISVRMGLWLLPVLLLLGVGSVCQWYWSELQGAGDLRMYATVQTYTVLFLLVMLLFPPKYTHSSDLGKVAGLYVLAKLLETFDRQVFAMGHVVSGHTLKHLAAALAGYFILRMLERRRPVRAVEREVEGAVREIHRG